MPGSLQAQQQQPQPAQQAHRCRRCGYVTAVRSNLVLHLQRKTLCEGLLDAGADPREQLRELRDSGRRRPARPEAGHVCAECGKALSSARNLAQHAARVHEAEKDMLKRELSCLREKMEQLSRAAFGAGATFINNSGNSTTVQGNQTINVQVNAFSRESMDHIRNNIPFLDTCVKRREKGFTELVERIHFDPATPENRNVRMLGRRDQFIQCFDGERWLFHKKHAVLGDILENARAIMQDHWEGHQERIEELFSRSIYALVQEFFERLDEDDRQLTQALKDDLLLLILNNSRGAAAAAAPRRA